MRILLIANKIPYPPKDGGSIASLNMAMGLSHAGAEVHVLAMNTSKHYFPAESIPPEVASSINLKTVYIDTDISPFKMLRNLAFSRTPYNAARFISSKFQNALEALLREQAFDIIQLEGLYLTPYIKTIRSKTNAVIALRAHNVEYEIWQRISQTIQNPIKQAYIKILAKRIRKMEMDALQHIDLLIPITERDGNLLCQYAPTLLMHVAPTGLDSIRFTKLPIPPQHPNTLFHIGGLDWIPNQEGIRWFLNNCWPSIRKEIPDAQFHIAGRNAPSHFLKSIPQEGVVYDGEVEDAERYMQDHAILIIPLLSGSGMRIKIVEGMALGKAIVSTKIGAEGIDATDGAQLFIANSPERMAEICISLLKSPKLVMETGMHAYHFAQEHFNNTNISSGLFRFYQNEVMKQRNIS